MASLDPGLPGFEGYQSKTFVYKTVNGLDLKLDAAWPNKAPSKPTPVLIHIHGGFLIIGDRYSFLPYWLINACRAREWIFVTPDYRLIPETTAHSCVEDAVDAYEWVANKLGSKIGIKTSSILLSGSSAGGYLALTTAPLVQPPPAALLSIYGVLDPAWEFYSNPAPNIFKMPVIDTSEGMKWLEENAGNGKALSGYHPSADTSQDFRMSLMSTFHQEALFPRHMTGVKDLAERLNKRGPEAISQEHRKLYVKEFGLHKDFPPTALVHGKNDSAVPVENSYRTLEKLKALGVPTYAEFPDDAEHGFDGRAGNIDVEKSDIDAPWRASLVNCIKFFDKYAS